MAKRKMEFESEAGPDHYGPVFHDSHKAAVEKMLELVRKMEEVGMNLQFLDAARDVANLVHDLDPACTCPTCTEVREIRSRYE